MKAEVMELKHPNLLRNIYIPLFAGTPGVSDKLRTMLVIYRDINHNPSRFQALARLYSAKFIIIRDIGFKVD